MNQAKVLLATMLLAASSSLGADTPAAFPQLQESVDGLFADLNPKQDPGCAVGVIHRGKYVLAKGYGLANLEHDIPISSASVFRIGSVSKQFTAMAIALLAEQGKLDLDADVHEYLPDLMDYGHKVTIRQMAHHTAGMRDYENDVFQLEGKPFRFGNEDYWTIQEFYQAVKDVPLRHAPGEQWQYSNLAYFLLSQVVEQVSGQTLRGFAAINIFDPLAMKNSLFNDHIEGVISQRADGYTRNEEGGYDILMTNLDWVGDGGVFTNLEDFIHWDQNFYKNRLGKQSPELLELMNTPGPIPGTGGSKPFRYAFGQVIYDDEGQDTFSHGGSWVGFRAYYERRPARELSVVVMCNADFMDAVERGEQIMTRALDELSTRSMGL